MSERQASAWNTQERASTHAAVLNRLRLIGPATKAELEAETGLGRGTVNLRVAELTEARLIRRGQTAPSTGGRAPRQLEFNSAAGVMLVAVVGATGAALGIADLSGGLLSETHVEIRVAEGPERCLVTLERIWREQLATIAREVDDVWGIGVGLPGPVEFATGVLNAPPIMPGWDQFSVRTWLTRAFEAPVWVDNEVNLMALGEARAGSASGQENFFFVKVGTGIGAGLVSNGALLRGAVGCAGDIGHVSVAGADVLCTCGQRGCLEAVASAVALSAAATLQATDSQVLTEAVADHGSVTLDDLRRASEAGDVVVRALLRESGRKVGEILAGLVNTLNPSLIVVGGSVAESGDSWLAAVREVIYRRSLPLATRELHIVRSERTVAHGLVGAAVMVGEELFSPVMLPLWGGSGTPRHYVAHLHRPQLASAG